MNPEAKIDTLIVGAGLAGCLLAWELIEHHGKSVLVIDNGNPSSASRVAAGLMNPVTGKRLVKTWELDQLLPAAVARYREIESKLNIQVYRPMRIRRYFNGPQEIELWKRRLDLHEYSPYLPGIPLPPNNSSLLSDPDGSFHIEHAGVLDTTTLLNALKQWLLDRSAYIEAHFDHDSLDIQPEFFQWKSYQADRVIFCEGFRSMYNPFFRELPFEPSKGEILKACGVRMDSEEINLRSKWIIPSHDLTTFSFGSTWEWTNLDEQPTEDAREQLMQWLMESLKNSSSLQVLEHRAGVRPSSKDRLPYLGEHPSLKNMHLFGGFSSKGSLYIPYLSKTFTGHIFEGSPLPPAVDIKRVIDRLR